MKVCAKANIMMSMKYLKELLKVYEARNQQDKKKKVMQMIENIQNLYWEE